MDLETLSNMILDDPKDAIDNNLDDNFLEHYGVPGMKWGVRKDRKSIFTKKRDRRYADETDKEYQARMNREFQERNAKARAKEQAAFEKRAAKERLQMQKMILKSQEKQQKLQMKSQKEEAERKAKAAEKEAERKSQEQRENAARQERMAKLEAKKKSDTGRNVKSMSDKDLVSGLERLKKEKEFLAKSKEVKAESRGILKKTLIGAGAIGGGVLIAVGKDVAKKQLTEMGNQRLEKKLIEKGWMTKPEPKPNQNQNKSITADDVSKMIAEALKKR